MSWRRRLPLEVVLLGGVVLAVFSFYGVMNVRGWLAVSRYETELKRRGDNLEVPPMTPERLARLKASAAMAARLEEVEDRVPPLETLMSRLPRVNPGTPVDLVAFAKTWLANESRGQLPTTQEEAATLILEALAAREPYLTELRNACRPPELLFPFGYGTPGTDDYPKTFKASNACLELRVRAFAHLALGNTSAAIEEIELMVDLMESLRNHPAMMSLISRLECRTIAIQAIWTPLAERRFAEADLRQLQALLGPVDLVSDYLRVVRYERNRAVQVMERIRETGDYNQAFGAKGARVLRLLPKGWLELEKVQAARLQDSFVQEAFLEWPKEVHLGPLLAARTNLAVLRERPALHAFWGGTIVAVMFVPNLDDVGVKTLAAQVMTDQAIIGCALEEYYLGRSAYPEHLAALVPRYLETLPKDPLSGADYRYALDGSKTYRIWSVGSNGCDDGGSRGRRGLYTADSPDWVWKVR